MSSIRGGEPDQAFSKNVPLLLSVFFVHYHLDQKKNDKRQVFLSFFFYFKAQFIIYQFIQIFKFDLKLTEFFSLSTVQVINLDVVLYLSALSSKMLNNIIVKI